MPAKKTTELGAVVMAAGLGTRMRSTVPKHLHPLLGRRMVDWVLAAAWPISPPILSSSSRLPRRLTRSPAWTSPSRSDLSGTGDAVRTARERLEGRSRTCSSSPATRRSSRPSSWAPSSTPIAARTPLRPSSRSSPDDPREYGRVLRDGNGGLSAIVEAGDATPEQLAVGEVNSSIYVFRSEHLWPTLDRLTPKTRRRSCT